MNDRHEESQLSTADMVSAANRQAAGSAAVEQADRPTAPAETRANGTSADTVQERPASNGAGSGAAAVQAGESAGSLFSQDDGAQLRSRWEEVQIGFVDEPRRAVEQADHLVAEVMKRMAELFAEERQGLEAQWNRGESADTEALRMALKRYRAFFERLLST